MIGRKFHREDADAICRIPLSRRSIPDLLVWLPNKNGVYSIKSSYHITRGLSRERDGMEESSSVRNKGLIWPRLWKVKLLSKIKVFGWRACQEILPTKGNLVRRRVIEDGRCEACKQETETVLHALWGCGVARDVWAGCQGRIQKRVGGQADFINLFEEMMDKLEVEELELFLVQCWVIWGQRKSVIQGGKIQDPSRLVKRAIDVLQEYRGTMELLAIHSSAGLVQKWEPPIGSSYKINFDAAVFAEINASGVGVIMRNDKGEAMAALPAYGPSVQDSEEAEVLACRRAVEFAVEAGFMELVLEGDNSTVMKSITSPQPNMSHLGHVYEDIKCIAASLRRLEVSFVKRSANAVAHALAKHARQIVEDMVWLEEDPLPAIEAMYYDSLNLN